MVTLADQGYADVLRYLGNEPGMDAGDVVITPVTGSPVAVPTSGCTILGELGVVATLPDGRRKFWLATGVVSIEDAPPLPPPPPEASRYAG
jgi:hypothetical protein